MIKICISVTSHALDPFPLSQTVTPSRTPYPLERDVLYGRPLIYKTTCSHTIFFPLKIRMVDGPQLIHQIKIIVGLNTLHAERKTFIQARHEESDSDAVSQ